MMNTYKITLSAALICIPLAVGAYLRKPKAVVSDQKIITIINNYQMADIIQRCQKDFGYTNEDMTILEQELKRFLVLCSIKENSDATVNMYSEHVDNLWHSFILFTKEYAEFCNQDELTPEKREKNYQAFCAFAKNYEKIFGEEVHPIWLLDRCSTV